MVTHDSCSINIMVYCQSRWEVTVYEEMLMTWEMLMIYERNGPTWLCPSCHVWNVPKGPCVEGLVPCSSVQRWGFREVTGSRGLWPHRWRNPLWVNNLERSWEVVETGGVGWGVAWGTILTRPLLPPSLHPWLLQSELLSSTAPFCYVSGPKQQS